MHLPQQRQPTGLQMLADITTRNASGESNNTVDALFISYQPYWIPGVPFQHNSLLRGSDGIGDMVEAHEDVTQAEVHGFHRLDEDFQLYLHEMKQIFWKVHSGMLAEAAESLLQASEWFLSHSSELGKQDSLRGKHAGRH